MRTFKEVEDEMWETGQKLKKLQQEYNQLLEINRKRLIKCLNEDGSWNLELLNKMLKEAMKDE